MKLSTFDMLRVWAMLTGVVLAITSFAAMWLGLSTAETLSQLVIGIGGFELMLFGQDIWYAKARQHG